MSHTDELEAAEVSMLDPDIVNAIRRLKALGHGTRSIAKLLEIDRKTVWRWLDGPLERSEDWRDGILSAWRHFGGVTRVLLVMNADNGARRASRGMSTG